MPNPTSHGKNGTEKIKKTVKRTDASYLTDKDPWRRSVSNKRNPEGARESYYYIQK